MSASETDICNMAMDLLGEDEMADFHAPATRLEGRLVRNYPYAKEMVLKKHRWKVARATLESIAALNVEDSQYTTVIQLPGDCLSVWLVNGREDGWERRFGQGVGRVAGDFTVPASIVYTRDLDEGELPIQLQLAIGAQLAALCMNGPNIDLTQADKKRIIDAVADTIDVAVDIVGAEGGVDEVFESRFVAAVHGYRVTDPHLKKLV